ncbi:hypothetical protein AURDEDRAFT_173780 [Auricularia subglabra TFB-10046 SS5]|nr:hypothetical protein AURDEDRAFT_173780 [Auricularia subglabra TFB-10046 SS5]
MRVCAPAHALDAVWHVRFDQQREVAHIPDCWLAYSASAGFSVERATKVPQNILARSPNPASASDNEHEQPDFAALQPTSPPRSLEAYQTGAPHPSPHCEAARHASV